jgi:hypothetical protein
LVVAYTPIYAILFVITIVYPSWWALTIHGVNLGLSAFIAVSRWKKTSPVVIVTASIFYATFMISTAAIPSFGSDIYFTFISPVTFVIYMSSIIVIALLVRMTTSKSTEPSSR